MKAALTRLLNRVSNIGVDPMDSAEVRVNKAITNVGLSAASLIFWFFIGPMYWLFNEPLGALTYMGFALIIAIHLILFQQRRLSYERLTFNLSVIALPTHFLACVGLGGFVNSGGIPLWGLVFPVLVMLIFYGPRRAIPWLVAFLANVVLSLLAQTWLRSTNNLPFWVNLLILANNITLISIFTFVILAYFVAQRDAAYRLLRGEQEKAEGLLLNILPKDIAAILKNEQRVIADSFEGASILFADVVNFTPMSAQMTPVELVELLNEVFTHFDTLVEKYGLEKIKTIGDCYMVASGVPRPRADHAQALVKMALEMQAYVANRTFRGRKLAFRIGINSGPVVAGVIGRKKFIYDLWGDAVNTASRMESHGAEGVIQITRSTHDLIQTEFECEPKGTVTVKGKGEMDVWHVKQAV